MPIFAAAMPISPVLDFEQAVIFYADTLSFTEIIRTEYYPGVEGDSVQLHFWLATEGGS